jgi:DNA-directed RNA polymerase specialized sigma subunit
LQLVRKRIDFDSLLSSAFTLPEDVRHYVIKLTKLREALINDSYNPEEALLEYQRTGDEDLLFSLVLYNLPMAVILVKRYSGYIDAHQVGDMLSIALNTIVRCTKKYDASMGTKFSSYLVINMKGEILKYLDEAKPVKYTYYYYTQKTQCNDVKSPVQEDYDMDQDSFDIPQFITNDDIRSILSERDSGDNVLESYVYEETDGMLNQSIEEYRNMNYKILVSEELLKCIDSISNISDSQVEKIIVEAIKQSISDNVKYTVAQLCDRYNLSKRSAYSAHNEVLRAIGDCMREKMKENPELEEGVKHLLNSF